MTTREQYERRRDDEPSLDDVIGQLDAADTALCMAYNHYLERPLPYLKERIRDETAELYDRFGDVLRKVAQGECPARSTMMDGEERATIIATMIHGIGTRHSRVLADFSEHVVLPTDKEAREALLGLIAQLTEDEDGDMLDREALVDEALSRFTGIMNSDWEIMDDVVERKWLFKFGRKALALSGDLAKAGAGAAIGVLIADRLRRR